MKKLRAKGHELNWLKGLRESKRNEARAKTNKMC